jgi:hypothetical protein
MKIDSEFLEELLKTWIWRMELNKHDFLSSVKILHGIGVLSDEQYNEAMIASRVI